MTQAQAEGIYTTLNPCLEALLARANSRLKANVERTKDQEITHLRNLLIDIDPVRPTDISSSQGEHDAALQMVREIQEDLAKEGWPEPLTADSGNGGHLVYPIDMENLPEHIELLKGTLQSLALRYASRLQELGLELDQKVFNPARISKLYGTVAGKGENLLARPHRRAKILGRPAERVPVARELLKKLVEAFTSCRPSPASGVSRAPAPEREGRLNVAAYLAHYGREVIKVKEHGSSTLFCLAECVFDPMHENNEAAVGQAADGKLFYQCFHNSCRGHSWAEARMVISGNDKLTKFIPNLAQKQKCKRTHKSGNPPEKQGIPFTENFSWSDLGNARRLVHLHGRDLHYCHLNKEWYWWTGKVWQVDNCGEAVRRAKKTVGEIFNEGLELAWDSDSRKNLVKFALKSEGAARIQGMLSLAQSEPGIPILPEQFDADPWVLNVQNGVIDLKNGTLKPHRREDLLTCISTINFNPDAECPKFEEFMWQIFGENQSIIDFVWTSFGYAMTGDCREQCFWIFWGSGANGKGTLIDCISHIFGSYRLNISTETLMARRNNSNQIRSDVARLDGPRLVTAAEIDRGQRLSESLIKGLSGQDTITARFLYGKDFDFVPQFKLFVQTNNKPVIRDQTNAMWRRLKLIKFGEDFRENPNLDLQHQLREESEGILSWLVRGCLSWQKFGNLGEPKEVKDFVKEYREEQDELHDFFESSCFFSPQAEASAQNLYEAYRSWAEDNLHEREVLRQKRFGLLLREKGLERCRRGAAGRWAWRGIGLRSALDDG